MSHKAPPKRMCYVIHPLFWRMLAMCLLLSACAMQPKEEQGFEQRLSQLQNEHRFGAARRAIEQEGAEPLDEEQKQRLLAENIKKAAAYEKGVISRARQQQNKHDWAKAGTTLNEAVLLFPESAALIDANNDYLASRDKFLREELLALRLMRATRIPTELQSLTSISAAGGGEKYTDNKEDLEHEATETAEALLVQGQKLLSKKRWHEARDVLRLSQNLQQDSRTETALRVATSNIAPLDKKRPKKVIAKPAVTTPKKSVNSKAVAAAMHRYRYELQRNNFVPAQQQIERARRLNPDDDALNNEYEQFISLLNSNALQHVEQGKYYYSLGDIDTAIGHWEKAYVLMPDDNSLKERLQKARRFKNRYEQLKR